MDTDDDEQDEVVTLQQAFDDTWGKKKAPGAWQDSFDAWRKNQSPAGLRQVVKSLDPVIESAVTRYVGQSAPPTVKHRARLIAAKAVQTYDPSRGAALNTHVYTQLQGLQRMAPAIADPFTPPERFRRQQQDITAAATALQEELGRDPTDEEVAEVSGLPASRVTKVRSRMRARVPFSAYEGSFDEDGDSDAPDIVASERTPYDEWVEAVYHDLGEIDKLILMHRTGYRNADRLSNQDIAYKLNLTPAAVSQRAARIQSRLDAFHAPTRRY